MDSKKFLVEDIDLAKNLFQIEASYHCSMASGGVDHKNEWYTLTDMSSNKPIGSVFLHGTNSYEGKIPCYQKGELLNILQEMDKTPRDQLANLETGLRNLRRDSFQVIESRLPLAAYIPQLHIPLSQRVKNNKQMVKVHLQFGLNSFSESHGELQEDKLDIPVGLVSHIPEKNTYSPSEIYSPGELIRSIKKDPRIQKFMQAYSRINTN